MHAPEGDVVGVTPELRGLAEDQGSHHGAESQEQHGPGEGDEHSFPVFHWVLAELPPLEYNRRKNRHEEEHQRRSLEYRSHPHRFVAGAREASMELIALDDSLSLLLNVVLNVRGEVLEFALHFDLIFS